MRKASEIFGDCKIDDLPKRGIDFLINALDINEKSLEVKIARKLDDDFYFTKDDMKKCADFWNRKHVEEKYFLEFLKTIIKQK